MQTLNCGAAKGGDLKFSQWGLIDYREALERQEALVELIAREQSLGEIVFCSHPPLVTLGRKTQEGDVFGWEGPVHEISRGGRATYHGPSQLVIYPILNLNFVKSPRDVHAYLRGFESAIIRALSSYGVKAHQDPSMIGDEPLEKTGVWIGTRKVASLGIAVRKWVSFHGAALNVEQDPTAFRGLKPCGYSAEIMVSLEELLGRKVDRSELQQRLQLELTREFQVDRSAAATLVSI